MDGVRFKARVTRPHVETTPLQPAQKKVASEPAATAATAATVAPSDVLLAVGSSALPLVRALDVARRELDAVRAKATPTTPSELVDHYAAIGRATATAQAALRGALDALDALDAHGAHGAHGSHGAPFEHVKARAFELLRDAGAAFAALEPSFGPIVHGGSGWPRQPVERKADRGDGRPLFAYKNTFKKPTPISVDEQRREYDARVAKFTSTGGKFEDIIVATSSTFARLDHLQPYDYVLNEDGTLRLFPTNDLDDNAPKPGHSLLAEGGPNYTGKNALLAGEIWVLKDSAGDVEAVLVANNSGHFKPEYPDLANAIPHLARLGIPPEKVVLFGGPNNLPSMFAEMEERCGLTNLAARLPPPPDAILDELQATKSVLSVRL